MFVLYSLSILYLHLVKIALLYTKGQREQSCCTKCSNCIWCHWAKKSLRDGAGCRAPRARDGVCAGLRKNGRSEHLVPPVSLKSTEELD